MNHLLSSPDEKYINHIERARELFEIVYPIFEPNLARLLPFNGVKDALCKMVIFHDLGKLTKRWQDRVGKRSKLPAHAPIGAAYLYKAPLVAKKLRNPICFAVAIHHSDKGLLGNNIEKPDVQAINNGIIKYADDKIDWDRRVDTLGDEYFSEEIKELGLAELKLMARGLRLWSRGCGLLEQHTRRMQVSLVHHILKLCDISAASKREEYRKDPDNPFGGWLMAQEIKSYIERISIRKRALELQNELKKCISILKEKYKPEKIFLFGSLVNGKIGEWSDIDLVIVKDTKKPFLDRSKEVLLFVQPRVGMDILVYTPEELERMSSREFFKKEILSKGVLL
jgi:CRISPR-associated endonuclease Cas3-HD